MGFTGRFRLVAGVLAAILCADASAENVIALGPVEQVSADGSVVRVVGQTFIIRNSASAEGNTQFSDSPEDLRLGTYLYIEGERLTDGTLVASSFQISDTPYVPGASEVLLTGAVEKFDPALGVATIGDAQIYLPNATSELKTPIAKGVSVMVVGFQANLRQQVWATEITDNVPIRNEDSGVSSLSIQGTGKQSIQGTGVTSLSIQGTGVNSLSIQGTGVDSLSIQGTGKQSIQGTGKQSIQGTGVSSLSIQGTGVNSLSIQGTGKQTIQGTEVSSLSIQGTGVNSLSIQGTGKQSIQGTGVTSLSIQGTGVNSLSIQGTGKQSIQGTGVTSLSIQGTGVTSPIN
jgi:hypothetical protein